MICFTGFSIGQTHRVPRESSAVFIDLCKSLRAASLLAPHDSSMRVLAGRGRWGQVQALLVLRGCLPFPLSVRPKIRCGLFPLGPMPRSVRDQIRCGASPLGPLPLRPRPQMRCGLFPAGPMPLTLGPQIRCGAPRGIGVRPQIRCGLFPLGPMRLTLRPQIRS